MFKNTIFVISAAILILMGLYQSYGTHKKQYIKDEVRKWSSWEEFIRDIELNGEKEKSDK